LLPQFDYPALVSLAAGYTPQTANLSPSTQALILSALPDLLDVTKWRGAGYELTPTEIDSIDALVSLASKEIMMSALIGTIHPYMGTLPDNALACDGGEYDGTDHPLLFARLQGTSWIAPDDDSRFRVPDLRGRFARGANGDWQPNTYGGSDSHVITTAQMPSHTHTTQPHTHTDLGHSHAYSLTVPIPVPVVGADPVPAPLPTESPSLTGVGNANLATSLVTVDNTGGGEAIPTVPAFVSVQWCVFYA
jgi:microcystin-dependent protein